MLESRDRIVELAPERIGHVTEAGRTVGQPLELVSWYARGRHHRNTAEPESVELTKRLDLEIGQAPPVFLGDVSDRERETRCDCDEQHLGRSRSGVSTADLERFIDEQLEVPDLDMASVFAIPGGGNASHE